MRLFGNNAQQKRIDADALTIADLRTKLKAAELREAAAKTALEEEKTAHTTISGAHLREINRGNRLAGRNAEAYRALRDIVAMKTDHCAHIGRKMAARAAEALPKDLGPRPVGNGVEQHSIAS